jgi:isoquinoline 1-oxidoreductase beta subunit
MLIQTAADIWKVNPTSCRAEKGFVIHDATKRRISYGKLVEKASQMEVPKEVPLKDPKDFKIIGKSMKRLDTPEKASGKAIFGMDVSIPGMLTAMVLRSPVFGGKVKSFNSQKTKAIPGVKDVAQIDSGVAVIAESFWSANKGREALEIVWDEGPLAKLSTEGMREE